MLAGAGRVRARVEHAPKFIPMAVALAKQPGVATRCFGNSSGSGRRSRPGGQTCPINLAAQNGSPEVMKALIENGASVTNVDGDARSSMPSSTDRCRRSW